MHRWYGTCLLCALPLLQVHGPRPGKPCPGLRLLPLFLRTSNSFASGVLYAQWPRFVAYLCLLMEVCPSPPISVLVADTAFLIRRGMVSLLEGVPNLRCAGEVADTPALFAALETRNVAVLVMDHCGQDCFTLDVVGEVRTRFPDLGVLVISHEKSPEAIRKLLDMGVNHYLLKDCDALEILEAIEACARGERYLCGQIVDVLLEKPQDAQHCLSSGITEREMEVIRQLVQGRRPREIAHILHISPYTVSTHKKNIYRKLGIGSSTELALYATRSGLIEA